MTLLELVALIYLTAIGVYWLGFILYFATAAGFTNLDDAIILGTVFAILTLIEIASKLTLPSIPKRGGRT